MPRMTRVNARLIDVEELAGQLGVSTRYVRRLVAERRIAYFKVGHLLRFDSEVVKAWIDACEVTPSGGTSSLATQRST